MTTQPRFGTVDGLQHRKVSREDVAGIAARNAVGHKGYKDRYPLSGIRYAGGLVDVWC